MGTQPNPSPKILFGPFEFEPGSGDLRKFGNRIRLQGKPLQILSILIERPGQVFSRDELQRQLWQQTTFVDFEQGLNTAVNKLRQALGDSADQPRFIETVPGKGYRFIAPLQATNLPPATVVKTVWEMAPPPTLRIEPRPHGPPRPGVPVMAWSLGVTAIVLVAGYWLATNHAEPATRPRPARFAIAPPAGFELESAAGRQSFALSPDGTRLAFTAMDTSGAFSAFVRELNSLEPRLLPGSEGVHTLFWAPDSRSLFLTGNGKVWRAPLGGDAHVVLGESPGFLFSGTWLSPERLLLSGSMTSYSIASSGGSPESLTEQYRWPQLLPDGEHILYVTPDAQHNRFRARVARFNNPDSSRDLIEADSRVLYTGSLANPGAGYLLYIRASVLLAQPFDPGLLRVTGEALPVVNQVYSFRASGGADFSVSNSGTLAYQSFSSRSQLVWVDRAGRRVGSAGRADINVKSGRLSPDGRKLAMALYDIERGGQNLWIVDLETGAMRQLTLEAGMRDAPVWSPDSKTLAFLHGVVSRQPRVAVRGTGENDAEEVLGQAGFQLPSDWSPDGRFIAFSNTGTARLASEIQSDVMLLDTTHGRQVIPVLSTRFHEANAAFSPDGKWLTFTSNESGRPEIYVQVFDSAGTPRVTGERHLVTRSGAQSLRWRRDGKELFYLGLDGRVYSVPAKLAPKPEFGPAAPLFTIPLEARSAIHALIGFDVSPDGKRFLIPSVNSQPGPSLVVMQNWEAVILQSRSTTNP